MKSTVIPSSLLLDGNLRLDASHYGEESWQARLLINRSPFEAVPLGGSEGIADVFMPPRFKRIQVGNDNYGITFLTGTEMQMARPVPDQYISRTITRKLSEYLVKEGWVLVTRSGTVGNAVFASKDLEDFAVTEDAIRVVPKNPADAGYLYCFLSSPLGKVLITKDSYGSVIDHIEPEHLAGVPIPLLPQLIQRRIHSRIIEASDKRVKANRLLEEADNFFYSELRLPRLDSNEANWFKKEAKAFVMHSENFDLRLDASYHHPVSYSARQAIEECKIHFEYLSELASEVFHPPIFKRMYVEDKEYGVPYITGAEMLKARPEPDKLLSKSMPNLGLCC